MPSKNPPTNVLKLIADAMGRKTKKTEKAAQLIPAATLGSRIRRRKKK